ncbi:TPA: DUF4224 domain-containing protein [Stenotrophomonas maltophilia]|uniref:DUF4224 domain-containing protein n=1 Tax=Stenotrophomonas maltophilia TaxID=40324 RepID=UPI0013D9CEFF|nr:DUF4224 domain-containing protein [Stenotrophomonas maltophilia]MBN5162420.1 DUF4224 domain-containing protein [Stenotrophomonas maltophilia]
MAKKNKADPGAGALCLSRETMRELCDTPYKDRQLAFLVLNGIPHFKGLDGWPRVLWATLEGDSDVETDKATVVAGWKSNKAA